jgi:hypothetical protein
VISKSPFTICDKFYKLNLEEKGWRKVESTGIQPEGRCGAKMCRVYDKLLLMGGYGSLPLKRYHPQAQYMEGGIGGVGYGWNNELLEFDPETACWSPVSVSSSKPSPRHGHTLTNIDENRAIMFGGQNLEESFSDLWLFDHKKKVWLVITSISSPWPQPRCDHTVCTLVCNGQEVMLLLMGGTQNGMVLDDCWLLHVSRDKGISKEFDCHLASRFGHSAYCAKLFNGTVVISILGGLQTFEYDSVLCDPIFFQWSMRIRNVMHKRKTVLYIILLCLDPNNPNTLHCGLPPTGAVLHPFGEIG